MGDKVRILGCEQICKKKKVSLISLYSAIMTIFLSCVCLAILTLQLATASLYHAIASLFNRILTLYHASFEGNKLTITRKTKTKQEL